MTPLPKFHYALRLSRCLLQLRLYFQKHIQPHSRCIRPLLLKAEEVIACFPTGANGRYNCSEFDKKQCDLLRTSCLSGITNRKLEIEVQYMIHCSVSLIGHTKIALVDLLASSAFDNCFIVYKRYKRGKHDYSQIVIRWYLAKRVCKSSETPSMAQEAAI